MTALNEKKIGKGNKEQIERSLHGTVKKSENKKRKQIRNEIMKEICSLFEAFLVFVFLSPDITNYYKLFMGSNSIFELSTMHSTPRLTRQMPQRELRSEPDLTLL